MGPHAGCAAPEDERLLPDAERFALPAADVSEEVARLCETRRATRWSADAARWTAGQKGTRPVAHPIAIARKIADLGDTLAPDRKGTGITVDALEHGCPCPRRTHSTGKSDQRSNHKDCSHRQLPHFQPYGRGDTVVNRDVQTIATSNLRWATTLWSQVCRSQLLHSRDTWVLTNDTDLTRASASIGAHR